ncbi:hypothetical protein NXF25_007802 [Crotalus adamanteus]|uniref:Uncharacterized protein n=1 Tax=Crotalus adamanteus TaxID=8729 RepID=A0AAW1BMI2_CROAD
MVNIPSNSTKIVETASNISKISESFSSPHDRLFDNLTQNLFNDLNIWTSGEEEGKGSAQNILQGCSTKSFPGRTGSPAEQQTMKEDQL